MSMSYFRFEHGAHFVLKGRVLPRTVSTEAKSSAQNEPGRRASVLAIFTIFCVNLLTNFAKEFIINLEK